jgi:predicted acyl esterase
MKSQFDYPVLMREGLPPSQATGKPLTFGPDYDERVEAGLFIQRNVKVAMRDGVHIYIDIYRSADPALQRAVPAVLAWSPYGKHNLSNRLWPTAGVDPQWLSPLTAFEAPDPAYWCARGYAIVNADPRGTWLSEGEMSHGGLTESQDIYDLIEWLGVQDWCNGKVGMSGVSYLAAAQWQVAPMRPPHLAALNPCEAFSDWYREFAYHGGIRETGFAPNACSRLNWSLTRTEDTGANILAHPLIDDYWRSKETDLAAIETPALVIASWSDQGLHLRGTLRAWEEMASKDKWLEIHGQKKWAYYYTPQTVERIGAFFDHFLRDSASRPSFPKVRLEVRERAHVGHWRDETEWPLARTKYTPLWLDAASGAMGKDAPQVAAEVRYDAVSGRAVFDHRFETGAEATGPMKLRLWVAAVGSDDMDLFVAIQKLDREGEIVPFVFYANYDDGPVALGWLRVSHRALDEDKSTPQRPVHLHTGEQRLRPGESVAVDIEIWPSSTRFAAGESVRVVIAGGDIYTEAPPMTPLARHQDLRNAGTHIIRTGGRYDSHLLVPFIPRPEP